MPGKPILSHVTPGPHAPMVLGQLLGGPLFPVGEATVVVVVVATVVVVPPVGGATVVGVGGVGPGAGQLLEISTSAQFQN